MASWHDASRKRSVWCAICFTGVALVVCGYVLEALLVFNSASQWGKTPQPLNPSCANSATSGGTLQGDEDLFGHILPHDASCNSRVERMKVLRRSKGPRHVPAPTLLSAIKDYASHHARCTNVLSWEVGRHLGEGGGGGWEEVLEREVGGPGSGCRFLVWIRYSGLGNNIMSLTSAFLYSLLTNRVLLVDNQVESSRLFCEPFPGSSWLLPDSFPAERLQGMNESHGRRLGNVVHSGVWRRSSSGEQGRLSSIYIHLTHTSNADDGRFFCEAEQRRLGSIPWLFLRSNQYFVPGLYFIQPFHQQLQHLFPDPETVFHFLARYLLHPSNEVWALVSRFFDAYLGGSEERLGVQLRTFGSGVVTYDHLSRQVVRCGIHNKLLPNISSSGDTRKGRHISVLVTCLNGRYHDEMKEFYLQQASQEGDVVSLHQLSREEHQNSDSTGHNVAAWAEMILLSLTDSLVTSSWSTFGYTAQGLAGVRPLVLTKGQEGSGFPPPDPPCFPTFSMEPCFHSVPLLNCTPEGDIRDPSNTIPFIRHCEDVPWGVKLFPTTTNTS